jgi:hypothetical protein
MKAYTKVPRVAKYFPGTLPVRRKLLFPVYILLGSRPNVIKRFTAVI